MSSTERTHAEDSMSTALREVYRSARRMAKVRYSVVTGEALSERLAHERSKDNGAVEEPVKNQRG